MKVGKLLIFVQSAEYTTRVVVFVAISVTVIPVWVLAVSLGVLVVMYTALGGLKAVVWTDVFQSGVMILGITAVIIQVTIIVFLM